MKVAEPFLEEALWQARVHQQEGNVAVAERLYLGFLPAASEQTDGSREIVFASYLRGKPQETYSWFRKAQAANLEIAIVPSESR